MDFKQGEMNQSAHSLDNLANKFRIQHFIEILENSLIN